MRDLLFHLPRRYDDFSRPMTLRQLREKPPEGPVSATVEIVDLRVEQGFRRRVQRTVARLRDETGEGEAIWFGRRYIERRLAVGDTVALSGKVELRGWLPRFANPEFGEAGDDALHAGRIVPVYRLTAGVTLTYAAPEDPRRARRGAARVRRVPARRLSSRRLANGAPRDPRWRSSGCTFRPISTASTPPCDGWRSTSCSHSRSGMVARRRQRQTESSLPIDVSDARFGAVIAVVEEVIGRQVAARRERAGEAASDVEVVLTADQLRVAGRHPRRPRAATSR